MAGMNAIEGGRWDNLLRRFFSIKERGVAPSLAPEIVPYFGVEDAANPEFAFLRGVKLAAGDAQALAGGAGTNSQVELRNPAGSDTLITCLTVRLWGTTTSTFQVAVGTNGAVGVAASQGLRDLRWLDGDFANIQRVVGRVFTSNTLAALVGFRIADIRILAQVQDTFPWPLTVPPGFSVFGGNVGQNLLANVGFVWQERPIEQSEL